MGEKVISHMKKFEKKRIANKEANQKTAIFSAGNYIYEAFGGWGGGAFGVDGDKITRINVTHLIKIITVRQK